MSTPGTLRASGDHDLSPSARRAALIVAGALFVEMLDATIVLTALPALARSFGSRPGELGIVVTAYAVALTALIPASAWVADRFGGRRVFVWAFGLFTLASMMCAAAPSLAFFVVARVVQGAAAAMMSPVGRLVVLASVERRAVMRAVAILTWPALVAPLIGPILSGWIVDHASWRWIFLINLPLGLIGMALALRWLPFDTEVKPRRPLDVAGMALLAITLACLVWGLDLSVHAGSKTVVWMALLGIAALGGVVSIIHLRRSAHPLVDLVPLAIPTFAASTAFSGALARMAINATPFVVPLMFQAGLRKSATQAGTMLLVYMAGNLAMKPLTTGILERYRFRDVLTLNAFIGAAALFGLSMTAGASADWAIWPLLFAAGLSRSMNFTATNTLAFADIEPAHRSAATALSGVLQQVAFSLGIALAAFALNASLRARGAVTLDLADFRAALWMIAAMLTVAAVGYWISLNASSGQTLRRQQKTA